MKYRVYSNELVFETWRGLGQRIGRLGDIMQNDVEVPEDQVVQWEKDVQDALDRFQKLLTRTRRLVVPADQPPFES